MNRSHRSGMFFPLVALASIAGLTIAQPGSTPATQPAGESRVVTPTGLTMISYPRNELVSQSGDTLLVQYTGRLANGKTFDSSVGREPFTIQIGVTGVIKGWTEGLVGMRVGERRTLIIPPDLGYGERGSPPRIPPNETLTFEVEVFQITRPAASGAGPAAAAPAAR